MRSLGTFLKQPLLEARYESQPSHRSCRLFCASRVEVLHVAIQVSHTFILGGVVCRMRSWKTQAGTTSSVMPGSTFVNLDTKYDTCVDLTRKV